MADKAAVDAFLGSPHLGWFADMSAFDTKHVCARACVRACVRVFCVCVLCGRAYVRTSVCVSACLSVYVCLSAYVCLCVRVQVCAYVCACL